ncbi:hypothetical protein FNU76_18140 [Chitinimonas arctica]|uniref:FecR protein domain-containing protein n=1 Tax=Chitinimonas arctica TaxID=2594795 RepID=A0A516SIX8_9NEIS|nr:FecR domain-containing protein [Chitinimonas arctica]QDQ28112.1 hypothetical protein FNU76_18140 [Chitinimonas arctica]
MFSKPIFSLLSLLVATSALAAANITSSSGTVFVTTAEGTRSALVTGNRVENGSQIVTGNNGLVVMRFDDGQVVALEKNTDFRIKQFRFTAAAPEQGNAFFSMLRGSLRAVTGLIGRGNKAAFRLETPTATIGIRGSDWMAALQNNGLFTGVNNGGIVINQGANTLLVDAGQYSATLGANTSQLVSFSQLPANVFGSLPNLSLSAAAGSASAGSVGSTAGTAGVSGGAIAAGAAVAAGVAATSNSDDSTATHHSPPSH